MQVTWQINQRIPIISMQTFAPRSSAMLPLAPFASYVLRTVSFVAWRISKYPAATGLLAMPSQQRMQWRTEKTTGLEKTTEDLIQLIRVFELLGGTKCKAVLPDCGPSLPYVHPLAQRGQSPGTSRLGYPRIRREARS
jgi:hypothetical protein